MDLLTYLFWPNPGVSSYAHPSIVAFLVLCALLFLFSFLCKVWRYRQHNAVTKKLTRTWSSAAFWFGLVGLILIVSRVEGVQFIGMRIWPFVWGAAIVLFALLQARQFRARHYEILPKMKVEDAREKYLPKKK